MSESPKRAHRSLIDTLDDGFKAEFVRKSGSLGLLKQMVEQIAPAYTRSGLPSGSKLVRLYHASAVPVDVMVKVRRAGVVPYVTPTKPSTRAMINAVTNNKDATTPMYPGALLEFKAAIESPLWFCMWIDASHNEITDSGGMRAHGETIEATAIRELREESCGIYDFDKDLLKRSIVAVRGNTCIFFVNVTNTKYMVASGFPTMAAQRFSIAQNEADTSKRELFENSSMLWIPATKLKAVMSPKSQGVPVPEWLAGGACDTTYPKVYDVVRRVIRPVFSSLEEYLLRKL